MTRDEKTREQLRDKFIQAEARHFQEWQAASGTGAFHFSCCGGRGLAVGCPRCGKVWPS